MPNVALHDVRAMYHTEEWRKQVGYFYISVDLQSTPTANVPSSIYRTSFIDTSGVYEQWLKRGIFANILDVGLCYQGRAFPLPAGLYGDIGEHFPREHGADIGRGDTQGRSWGDDLGS